MFVSTRKQDTQLRPHQRRDEDSLQGIQGTGRRRQPAQVLQPAMQDVGVLLELQGCGAWISNKSPCLCWYQRTQLQRCMQPQPVMANVRGWRHVLAG